MEERKRNLETSALVEGAMMTAITVVLALVSAYIPIIEMVAFFVIPIPMIVLILRRNMKLGILATAASSILIFILVTPTLAVSTVLRLTVIGLSMGYCLYRKMKPAMTLMVGTVASLISTVLMIVLSLALMQVNPITEILAMLTESVNTTLNMIDNMAGNMAQMASLKASYESMLKMLPLIIPIAIVLSSVFSAVVNYFFVQKILKRFRIKVEPLPSVAGIMIPRPFAYALVGLLLLSLFAGETILGNDILYRIYLNVSYGLMFLFIVDGIAVLYFFMKRAHWKTAVSVVLIVVILMSPLSSFLMYAGLIDVFWDFRKLKKQDPDKKMMEEHKSE